MMPPARRSTSRPPARPGIPGWTRDRRGGSALAGARCGPPAGVAGEVLRLQLLRPQDRAPAPGRAGAGGRGPARAEAGGGSTRPASRSWRGAFRRRWSTSWPPRPSAPPMRQRPGRCHGPAASPRTSRSGSASRPAPPARGLPLFVPRPGLCTDNGAMIGAAGWRRFVAGERAGDDLGARPAWPLVRPAGRRTPAGLPGGGRPARAYEIALAAERDGAGGAPVPAARERTP